jgi:hypothetical protein
MSRRVVMAFGLLAAMAGAVALYDGALSPRPQSPGTSSVHKSFARSGDRSATVDASLRVKVTPATDRTAVLREPLPAPGSPFMQIYDGLKARVAQGDHRAACRIGYELDRCKRAQMMRYSADYGRKLLRNPTLTSENRAGLERSVESAEKTLRESEVVCRDVPDWELPRTWDYYLAAAIAGNDYAIYKVSFFPPGLDYVHREETLEGWMQWRQYVPELMEQALQRGDPRIVALASRDSRFPREGVRVRPLDDVKAVGYQMALLRGVSETSRSRVQRDLDSLLAQVKLTPAQVEEARAFAATVPLRVPQGGIDMSRGTDAEGNGKQCEQS